MTQYTYNGSSDKLTKVEQKSGGVVKAAVEYGYTKDQLTRITHNGFDYTLTYDKFGNPLTTKVAGQALSTNIYGPRNGFLERMNYGNGAYIEYQYDPLYRVNAMWLNGFKRNGVTYTYVYNGLGDVMEILDKDGNAVVSYLYDAWGAPISITGPMASTLGVQNPIRYRGYYYDTETGLYYLQSRYYDPVVGRFLNADGYVSTGQGILGTNMFAYCGNNPVSRFDVSGCNWLDALSKLFMSQEQWRALEKTKFGTPIYGEPNSWLHIPSSSGTNDIDRYFGPDGRAHHDVHWGHAHHHPGVGSPHTEDWKWDGDRAKPDPDSARPYDPAKDGTPPPHPQSVPQPSQSSSFTIDPQVITVVTTAIFVIGGIYILLTTGDPTVLEEAFAR